MKKQITLWLALAVVIVAGVMIYQSVSKVAMPVVADDGKVSGEYSIESIMTLGKPYVCAFEKKDDESQIKGTIRTDGRNIFGEFRILTKLADKEFNSFLLVKGDDTYTWTSIAPIGYKSKTAKSASTNASPVEQSQIVGTRDKMQYECEPWVADATVFDPPSWIVFSEPK